MTIEERAYRKSLKMFNPNPLAVPTTRELLVEMATEQKAIDHSKEHLNWIIKQHHLWSYEMRHCDNNECCTFKEWIDKAMEE